jgi:erythronate-4-phosphate dehydrogenase
MKVIVDDKIPYIRQAIARLGLDVLYVSGARFSPELIHEADALIVRTRTRCDEALLDGSRVRFIATATIGFDHIDVDYCRRAGIAWTNAPGCNASSVAQYVESALLLLEQSSGRALKGQCIGIVGVGEVGSRVAHVAHRLGMHVLLNDPPRAAHEGAAGFSPLSRLLAECDLLTLHVPLTRAGEYPTFHLADAPFFAALHRRPVLINTSRGEVVDTGALLGALRSGAVCEAIVDVWEDEPDISRELLDRAFLATPHIAGYSADGKANAARMALDALCRHFGLRMNYRITPPPLPSTLIPARSHAERCLQLYDPRVDCQALRAHPQAFEQLRENYPLRREHFSY